VTSGEYITLVYSKVRLLIEKKLQRKEKDRKLAEKTPTKCPTELEQKLLLEREMQDT
jgi:hypothetical protein